MDTHSLKFLSRYIVPANISMIVDEGFYITNTKKIALLSNALLTFIAVVRDGVHPPTYHFTTVIDDVKKEVYLSHSQVQTLISL